MVKQTRWRLDDLYPNPDSPEYQKACEQIEAAIQSFEALRPRLTPDLASIEFLDMLKKYEDLIRLLSRVLNYGFLLCSEDLHSYQAQVCWRRAQQIAAQAERRTLFFSLWWNAIDETAAEKFINRAAGYQYWLKTLRLQKPFTLSEREEEIINLKSSTGSKALVELYEAITGRYVFKLKIDNEIKQFTRHELNDYVRDPSSEVRAAAYQEYFRVLEKDAPILGKIYQQRVQDWRSENILLRGYASPIAVRNLHNDLPDAVVEVLLEVCRKNVYLFQRYFQLKARALGVERLRRYDIYAPVTSDKHTYEFQEAVHLVLESFQQFDPHLAELANQLLEESHLDSEVRDGKRPGAFCVAVEPDLTPWLSMTFEGGSEDIATLARELGRAVHFMMAADQTAFTQKASRMLSEVASTFCEILTIDHLIATVGERETHRELLFRRIDKSYSATLRQAYFVMFEQAGHDRIHAGASVDELSELYLEYLMDQFSGSIDLSADFRYEWLGISSFFHLPFYAYAYAFGRLLVLSLYHQYQAEGDSFKSRYLSLLAAGGSDSPARILDQMGIDITSEEVWQSGFDALAMDIEELDLIESLRGRE